jgi:hypothetical protein
VDQGAAEVRVSFSRRFAAMIIQRRHRSQAESNGKPRIPSGAFKYDASHSIHGTLTNSLSQPGAQNRSGDVTFLRGQEAKTPGLGGRDKTNGEKNESPKNRTRSDDLRLYDADFL